MDMTFAADALWTARDSGALARAPAIPPSDAPALLTGALPDVRERPTAPAPLDVFAAADVALARAPQFGAPACDDVPTEIGALIVGTYAAILIAFGLVFFGAGDVLFMLGVCAVYLAVYLGTPVVLLRTERRGRSGARRAWADFLTTGLDTATGRTSASAVLAQMLAIPAALVVAVLGIGVMMRIAG